MASLTWLQDKIQVKLPFGSRAEVQYSFQNGGHGGHFWFPAGIVLPIFDLQVTLILPMKFWVKIEKKIKIGFQQGGHLGFLIGMILATFDIQVSLIPPIKFWVLFVCVEVLQPSQPNGVMSSPVSLPNHMFTGQA